MAGGVATYHRMNASTATPTSPRTAGTSPAATAAATAATSTAHAPTLTAAQLTALLADRGVTLIDFTAAWCGPCKHLTPILADLGRDYSGRAKIVAVDVQDQPALAQTFRVTAMPTLVLIRDGREVGRMVGTRPKPFIAGVIERALAGDLAIASP